MDSGSGGSASTRRNRPAECLSTAQFMVGRSQVSFVPEYVEAKISAPSVVHLQDEGTLPECVEQSIAVPPAPKGPRRSKVWYPLRVVLGLRTNGDCIVRSVSDCSHHCMRASNRNRPQPMTEAELTEKLTAFTVSRGNGISLVVPNCWCFQFAMHVDGTPWLGELMVPDMVISAAQDTIRTP